MYSSAVAAPSPATECGINFLFPAFITL